MISYSIAQNASRPIFIDDSRIESISNSSLRNKIISIVQEIINMIQVKANTGNLALDLPFRALPTDAHFELIKDLKILEKNSLEVILGIFYQYFSVQCESLEVGWKLSWSPENTILNPKPTFPKPCIEGPSFPQYCESFINNPLCSDVNFCVEGQIIYGHKLILMRCQYFKSMFQFEPEKCSGSIIMGGCRVETFLAFIRYLYTDKIDFFLIISASSFINRNSSK